ncbi:MAG: DUF2807 domain-containing protein [Ferruginibacter sp.]
MKKLSLLTLVIAIAASSFAQTSTMGIIAVKEIKTDEIVTSLKVYNNVEVVLTSNEMSEIQIIGEISAVKNTTVKIQNGELIITNSSEDFCKDNVVVFVPASALFSIYVHGASTVSSIDILDNDILDITINGAGKSTIQTIGMISLNTVGDFPAELSAN